MGRRQNHQEHTFLLVGILDVSMLLMFGVYKQYVGVCGSCVQLKISWASFCYCEEVRNVYSGIFLGCKSLKSNIMFNLYVK